MMFSDPVGVAFKADNCKYIARIYYISSLNTIEAIKPTPDAATRFLATQSGGKLLLLGNNGKYLSRIHRGSIDFIDAAKSIPDAACLFVVYNQADGTVVLKATNGKYLSRIHRGDFDYIEAAKSQIDSFCKFRLEFLM